tara:strand:+ start:449 stop:874 length:426 start_codon:yes stop_codon:yes gene_type:complete
MIIEELPLRQKTFKNISHLFSLTTCKVAVLWIIYDPKKKCIIDSGSSRARGCNFHKSSTHAEQIAWNKLRSFTNKDKYEIYIWRWDKNGEFKPTYCCNACTQLAKKYNFYNQIYTFKGNQKISAIVSSPSISLGYIILHNS